MPMTSPSLHMGHEESHSPRGASDSSCAHGFTWILPALSSTVLVGRVLGVRGCRKSFSLTPEKKGPHTVQTHPTPSRRCQCTGSTNRPTGRTTPCTCPNHGHLSKTGASIPGLPHLTAPQCLGRYICSMSLPTSPLPRNFCHSPKTRPTC